MATQNSTPSPAVLASSLARFERHLYARRGLAEVTVHNHVSAIRRLAPSIGIKPTPRAIEKHIERMHKSGASYSHIVNTCVAIESYCAFLHRPIKLGRPAKPKRLVRGTLTEAEVTLLIHAANTLREKAMIAVLAYGGVRNRELGRLRVCDVNLGNGTLFVRATKPQKERNVHIAPTCVSVLAEYLRERGGEPSDLLFVTLRGGKRYQQQCLRKMIKAAAKRAGLAKRVYPHLLRHSLATNMLRRGAHLLAIKDQLGHVFVETTMIYIDSDPSLTEQQYRMYAPSYL